MGSINGISSSYLQSVLSSSLQGTGLTTSNQSSSINSVSLQPDSPQLSPFAQLMSQLQKLQQSDPAKYQQVTQQIATNLQDAAQTAQASGNSTAANRLNQLAGDFSNASTSSQLPNVQDLAHAIGGHHHHHHVQASSSDTDSGASTGATSTSGGSGSADTLSQLLSAFQANANQSDSLNPATIILDTLSSAGITASNS